MSIPEIAKAFRDRASQVQEDDIDGYAEGAEATLRILVEKGALTTEFYSELVAELTRQDNEDNQRSLEDFFAASGLS